MCIFYGTTAARITLNEISSEFYTETIYTLLSDKSMKMHVFYPHENSDSDYNSIRNNGMWYEEWQSGYEDILKRGYPLPKYKTTILAELYSPNPPDFLHGGIGNVPFLVSPRTKTLIRSNRLSGIRFSRVEVVKIATKGKGKGKRIPKVGEPEDLILKAKDLSSDIARPKLHAVYVTGRFEIVPKYSSGRCPLTNYVTPYDLPKSGAMPDLWRPTIKGRTFSACVYCSQRFRDLVVEHSLSNICFETFEVHMSKFRKFIEEEIRGLNNDT